MENPVKVLVTGASGLLGRAIMTVLGEKSFALVGIAFSRVTKDLRKCDLREEGQFEALVDEIKPQVIIHSAAERFPDKVENNFESSKILNVNVSGRLASVAKNAGSRFIYISTDYVFDGKNPPYSADDTPNPLNKYGETKFLGEKAVLENYQDASILRVPVLYGDVEYLEESGVTTLLNNLLKKEEKAINHTQKRYPVYTRDIAGILCDLITLMQKGKDIRGIYQWSGKEQLTKYDMVVKMAQIFILPHNHLTPDVTQSPTTNRPNDCLMSNKKLEELGINNNTSFHLGIKESLQKFL